MTRLHRALTARRALVTYLMAGDGDVVSNALACVDGGADVIELGFPFSDPIADGPVIQRAAHRSLANGTTLAKVLQLARTIRTRVDVPLVLMGYVNPVMSFGLERFVEACSDSGVDGLILPDLPPDEATVLRELARTKQLGVSFLVAPTSTPERERLAATASTGFVYVVSVTGVTGARAEVPDVHPQVQRLRTHTSTPVLVGFGVSGPEQARALGAQADGVIVGSALVERVARAEPLTPFVRSLRTALETTTC